MFQFLCCTSEAIQKQVAPYHPKNEDDSFQFSLLSSFREKPKGMIIQTNRTSGADTSVFFSNFASRTVSSVAVNATVMDDIVLFLTNLNYDYFSDPNVLSIKDMNQLVRYNYDSIRPKNSIALFLLQIAIRSPHRNNDVKEELQFVITSLGIATTFIERMRNLEENFMQQPDANVWLPLTENGYVQLQETQFTLSLKSCLALTDIVLLGAYSCLSDVSFSSFPEDTLDKIALGVDCLFLRFQSLGPLFEGNASQVTKYLMCQTLTRACKVVSSIVKHSLNPVSENVNKINLRLVSMLQSLAPNLSMCRHNCGDLSRDVLTAFWAISDAIIDRVLCSTTQLVPNKHDKFADKKSNNWFSSNESHYVLQQQQQSAAAAAAALGMITIKLACVTRIRHSMLSTLPSPQDIFMEISRLKNSNLRQSTLSYHLNLTGPNKDAPDSIHNQDSIEHDSQVDFFNLGLLKFKHALIGMQYMLRIGTVDAKDLRINTPNITDWYTSIAESLLLVLSIPFRGPGRGLGGTDDFLVLLAPLLSELFFHVIVGADIQSNYDWIFWELTKRLSNYVDVTKRKLKRAKQSMMSCLNSHNFTSLFDNDAQNESAAEITGRTNNRTHRSQQSSRVNRMLSGDSAAGDFEWSVATPSGHNQNAKKHLSMTIDRKRSPSALQELMRNSTSSTSLANGNNNTNNNNAGGGETASARKSSYGSHTSSRSIGSTRKNSINGPVASIFGRNLSGGVPNKQFIARNNSGTAPASNATTVPTSSVAGFGRNNSGNVTTTVGIGRNNSGKVSSSNVTTATTAPNSGNSTIATGFARNNSGGVGGFSLNVSSNGAFGRTNSGGVVSRKNSGVVIATTIVRNNSGGVSAVLSPVRTAQPDTKSPTAAITDSPLSVANITSPKELARPPLDRVEEIAAPGHDMDTARSNDRRRGSGSNQGSSKGGNILSWIKSAASPYLHVPHASTTAAPPSTAPPANEKAFSLKLMSKLLVHAAPKFVVGDKVEVKFPSAIGSPRWVTGKIICVNNDSTYNVTFTDGKTHNNKPEDQLRKSEGSDRHSDRRSERERTKRVHRMGTIRKSHTVRIPAVAIPVVLLKYKQGDFVDGLYQLRNKTKRWFPGTIARVNIDGTYRIEYLDGDVDDEKKATELRMTKRRLTSVSNASLTLNNEAPVKSSTSSRFPPQFVVNDYVDGLHTLQNGSRRWFPGVVLRVNPDGTYDVEYNDGDVHEKKPENELRVSKTSKRRPSQTDLESSHNSGEFPAISRSWTDFSIGDSVDAVQKKNGNQGWFSGEVTKVNQDNTFEVVCDNGTVRVALSKEEIRASKDSAAAKGTPPTSLPVIQNLNLSTSASAPVVGLKLDMSRLVQEKTQPPPQVALSLIASPERVVQLPQQPQQQLQQQQQPPQVQAQPEDTPELVVGTVVDGEYTMANGSKRWFPGKIIKVHDCGARYDVEYNDGDIQCDKPASEIRAKRSRAPRPRTPIQDIPVVENERSDAAPFVLKMPNASPERVENNFADINVLSARSNDTFNTDDSGEHLFVIPSVFDNNVVRKEKEGLVPMMRISEINAEDAHPFSPGEGEYLYEDDEYDDEYYNEASEEELDGYDAQDEAACNDLDDGDLGGELDMASDIEGNSTEVVPFAAESHPSSGATVNHNGVMAALNGKSDSANVSSRSSTGIQGNGRSWCDVSIESVKDNKSMVAKRASWTRKGSVPSDLDSDCGSAKKQLIVNLSEAPLSENGVRTQLGQLPLHLLHDPVVEVMPELMVRTYSLICAVLLRRCIVDKHFLDATCCQSRILSNTTNQMNFTGTKMLDRTTSRASSRASSRQSSARSSKSGDSDRGPAPLRHINLLFNVREFIALIPDQHCFSIIFEMACLLGPAYSRLVKLLCEKYFDCCLPGHMDQSEKIGEGGFGNIIQITCPAECSKMEAKRTYCQTSRGNIQLHKTKLARWEKCNCAEGSHLAANTEYCSPVKMQYDHQDRKFGLRPVTYAVKRIPREKNVHDTPMLNSIFNEISTLESLKGLVGVCQLLDYGVNAQEYWIVMELGGPNLSEWRRRNIDEQESGVLMPFKKFFGFRGQDKNEEASYHFSKDVLSIEDCAKCLAIFVDALYIMKSVHEADVAHFDLKCNNFILRHVPSSDPNEKVNIRSEIPQKAPNASLIDPIINFQQMREFQLLGRPSGNILLIDFGEAVPHMSSARATAALTTACRGTLAIQSPEILSISPSANNAVAFPPPSKSSDVWALGCLLVELLTGDYLFCDRQWTELFVTLCTKKFSSASIPLGPLKSSLGLLPQPVQHEIIEIVTSTLIQKPALRPQISELIQMVNRVLAMDVFRAHSNVIPPVNVYFSVASPIHGSLSEEFIRRDRMDESIVASTIGEISQGTVELSDRVIVLEEGVSLRIESHAFRPLVLSASPTLTAQLSNLNILKLPALSLTDPSLFEPRGSSRKSSAPNEIETMANRFDDVDSLIMWSDLKRTIGDISHRILDNWTLQSNLIQLVLVNSESELKRITKFIHDGQLENSIKVLDLTVNRIPDLLPSILHLFDLLSERILLGDKVVICLNSTIDKKSSFNFDERMSNASNNPNCSAKVHSKLSLCVAFALTESLMMAHNQNSNRLKAAKNFSCSTIGMERIAPDLDALICRRVVEVILDHLSSYSSVSKSRKAGTSEKSGYDVKLSARQSISDHTDS